MWPHIWHSLSSTHHTLSRDMNTVNGSSCPYNSQLDRGNGTTVRCAHLHDIVKAPVSYWDFVGVCLDGCLVVHTQRLPHLNSIHPSCYWLLPVSYRDFVGVRLDDWMVVDTQQFPHLNPWSCSWFVSGSYRLLCLVVGCFFICVGPHLCAQNYYVISFWWSSFLTDLVKSQRWELYRDMWCFLRSSNDRVILAMSRHI